MRVAITTIGCRLNQSESDGLAAAFALREHQVVAFRERADLYVVNTCAVTLAAEADARRAIRRARQRGGPNARIVVTGCYAQRAPEVCAAVPGVDVVVGNDRKADLPILVGEDAELSAHAVGDVGSVTEFARLPLPLLGERTRAYLRVQDGCEDVCSFCVVPQTRGRFRSLPPAEASSRLAELVAAGTREVVLTGANLSSYGEEAHAGPRLSDLLAELLRTPGDYRLRLSSLEPSDLTPALLDLVRAEERLCPHLHLPVQSLSDSVLARMRRSYSAVEASEALERAAERVPGIALGTDLMVGFPGETDGEFDASLERLRRLPLAYGHVFAYSERPGTEAAAAPDDVPGPTKKARSLAVRRLLSDKHNEFVCSQLGETHRVLLETKSARGQYWRGYTDNYLRVRVPAAGGAQNTFAVITLTTGCVEALRPAA